MTHAAVVKSGSGLATLRHQLLTPLNHILGYSEMLLEDSGDNGFNSFSQHLTRIRQTAKDLIRLVQTGLAPGQGRTAEKMVSELRYELSGPVHRILQEVGSLTGESEGDLNFADVVKIGRAAAELLTFAQGRATPKSVVPAHRRRGVRRSPTAARILVVDDNKTSREILARQLRRQGHEVAGAGSGAEALSVLLQSRHDLVLLDILMPMLDGFQVLEKMKADPSLTEIPVIVISALDEIPGVVRSIEIGAEDYLFKPLDPILLGARIDSCLEKKRLHDLEKQRAKEVKAAFEQLHLSEERLRLALKADRAGIWDWDLIPDVIVRCGDLNRLFGLTPETSNSKFDEMLSIVHPDDRERVHNHLREAIRNCEDYQEEYRIVRPDGSIPWVESMAVLYCDDDKRPVRMIGVTREITERKLVEAALRRSNQDFQRFALAASHDLKEPLRAVSKDLQMLVQRSEAPLGAEGQRIITSAMSSLDRMSNLISDLLNYSQVSAKKGKRQLTSADAVVAMVLNDLKIAIEETGAVITHDPLPVVLADFMMLQRVFQNLISNSIKYRGQDPPRIHISAQPQGEMWVFRVSDNGIGVEPKYKTWIFGLFRRLHGRDVPGSGLGLAMCRRIVEQFGGTIWLESEVGKGSCFYFTVPSPP